MRKIKEIILSACGYTVLAAMLLFAFVSIDTVVVYQMTFSSFAIIFGMCALIAIAKLIFEIESFPYYVRLIIHFLTLLGLIMAMLGFIGYLNGKKIADYFVMIAAYTLIYAIISLVSFGFSKLFKALEKKNTKASPKSTVKSKSDKKSDYKPLYK